METGIRDPLLRTKFQSPYLPDDFVPREELTDYVLKNISRPLLLVSAGSGSGKTLFVSSLLQKLPYPYAWLSLDSSDNDLRNFLTYFVAAIRQELHDFGERFFAFISPPQLPSLKDITAMLVNDLNNLTEDFVLILDDLHLAGNPDIYTLLSSMLEFMPVHFHLILISRQDPPLPLERLRAKNKLTVVDATHLKLSLREIKTFVEKNFSLSDPVPLAKVLEEKTEGWVTGLRLALLHLSFLKEGMEQSIRSLRETDFSGNYFMEEVLENLDPLLTEFLLRTSVLERFSFSLTDYLMGFSGKKKKSSDLMQDIRKMHLFVVNLDKKNKWFRYHHLFQEFLQKELETRYSQEEIRRLHQRAVDWYEANQLLEEAFYHAEKAGDHERIARMIEEHMDRPLNEDKWYILDEWLAKLPRDYIHERPSLLVALMWVTHNKSTWLISDLLKEIDSLGKNIELAPVIRVQVRFFRGVIQYWSMHFAESIQSFEYVRKNLPKEKTGAISINNYYYLISSYFYGAGEKAVNEIEKILLNESLDPYYRAMLIGGIAYVRMLEGNLEEVLYLSGKIGETGRHLRDAFLSVWAGYLRGMAFFYQNRLPEAEKEFDNTLDNVYMLNLLGPLDDFAGYVLTLQTRGKKKKEAKIFEKMQEFVRRRDNPAIDSFMHSFRARKAIFDGDTASAGKYIQKVNMFFEAGTLFFWIETPRVTYCKYLLALQDPEKTEEAAGRAGRIEQLARKTRNIPQLIQILVLQAVIRKRKGDVSAAEALLTEALIKGTPGSWVRPFFEGGEEVREMLDALPRQLTPETDMFRERILDNFAKYPLKIQRTAEKHPGEDSFLPDEETGVLLTNRELDVLHLIAARLSNKEIAGKLFIAVATVKSHTVKIYKKLGVSRRREAVLKAEELGILPVGSASLRHP